MFEVLKKVFRITPFGTAYVFFYHIVSGIFVALKLNFTMNIIESGYKYIIDSWDINSVIRYFYMKSPTTNLNMKSHTSLLKLR